MWHFRRRSDSAFTGGIYSGPVHLLEANTPEGFVAVQGGADHSEEIVPAHLPTTAELASRVRERRDVLLAECDWVTLRAADRAEPAPSLWLAYRQALRDVPQQASFPMNVLWPAAPAA